MENIVKLDEFRKMFEEYKKTNSELITLKTKVLDDILKYSDENKKQNIILLSQTYNLIVELKNRGVTEEEIKEIISLKK